MKKLIAIIGILAILVWSGWRLWYSLMLRAVESGSTQRVALSIEQGTTTNAIASLLYEKSLIRSPLAFKAYVRNEGYAGKLQAGSFIFNQSMDVPELVQTLLSGKTAEIPLTIPEGYTVSDIDALLVSKGLIQQGAFIECANSCSFTEFSFVEPLGNQARRGGRVEGFLYPDTYFVPVDQFDVETFMARMLSTFRTNVIDVLGADIGASTRSLHDIVTMASLIEEEAATAEERGVVSGILWKRLDEGIGLYVDASNRYIANKPTAALTQADLAEDTPYNLRLYRGLPPGPIANPGIESIIAALNPQSSPYYYYLHGNDGKIRYAITNDEHNVNKARYLR